MKPRSEDDCILWKRATAGRGYGYFREGGKAQYIHRRSFEAFYGPLREGQFVMHTCDEPACYNPLHLVAGTHEDNMRDMASKGRASNGNRSKTNCPQGHPYDEENTCVSGGKRYCRKCLATKALTRYYRNKEKKCRE
jgi:hypothetical protein